MVPTVLWEGEALNKYMCNYKCEKFAWRPGLPEGFGEAPEEKTVRRDCRIHKVPGAKGPPFQALGTVWAKAL